VLRVAHVLARLPAAGTERQLVGLLGAAHGRRWDARLLVLFPGGALVDEVRALGVDVVEGPSGPGWSPARLATARRVLRDADVVHAQLWGANLYARIAAGLGPRRPAVVCAERRVEDFRGGGRRALDRAAAPLVDAWIANSGAVADFVAHAHRVERPAVAVIPNGLDATTFRPRTGDRTPGPIRLGTVSRLVHQKGIDVAVDAVARLVAGGHEVELVVAGDGPDRAALEARAVGLPVRFVGPLASPAAVAAHLRGLDAFLLPSRYEGLPNALLEARATGLPAVVTDGPGVAEAAGPGTTVMPVDDPGALAAAVATLIADGPPMPAPAASFRSFDDVAADHLATFEQALAHHRDRRTAR
jgi:glycosyltransferase involved in cell wall biosynthesis